MIKALSEFPDLHYHVEFVIFELLHDALVWRRRPRESERNQRADRARDRLPRSVGNDRN